MGEGVFGGVADVVYADPDGDEGFGDGDWDEGMGVGFPLGDLVDEGDGERMVEGGATYCYRGVNKSNLNGFGLTIKLRRLSRRRQSPKVV